MINSRRAFHVPMKPFKVHKRSTSFPTDYLDCQSGFCLVSAQSWLWPHAILQSQRCSSLRQSRIIKLHLETAACPRLWQKAHDFSIKNGNQQQVLFKKVVESK